MAGGEGRATGIALWIGGACSLVIVVLLNAQDPVSREAYGYHHSVLSLVCLVPFGLALGGLAGRRVLLLPAAVTAAFVGPVLWSGLPLLWIPAIAYVVALARTRSDRLPWWRTVPAVGVPILLTLSALVLLFTNTTESCAQSGGHGACGGVPPAWQTVSAAALAVAAVGLGWAVARPQPSPAISPGNPHVVGLVPHRSPQAK